MSAPLLRPAKRAREGGLLNDRDRIDKAASSIIVSVNKMFSWTQEGARGLFEVLVTAIVGLDARH